MQIFTYKKKQSVAFIAEENSV